MTQRNIRPILEQGLGRDIGKSVLIEEASYTYPIKDNVWDNWLPFAYRAFSKIAQRRKDIRSFATIGCSSGADAFGAYYAFPKLETIILSDIDERAVALAQENVARNTVNINLQALSGPLCTPLRNRDIHVDLIYENLPNIPDDADLSPGYRRSSRFIVPEGPADSVIDKYLLRSHADFLQQAHDVLPVGGIALCSIGGRVPYYIIMNIVKSHGYHCIDLVNGFKLQTELEEVLPGYAQAETSDIKFDFYRYDAALARLRDSRLQCRDHLEEGMLGGLQGLDEKFRISAREALKLYEKDNSCRIGHTVNMIAAIRK